LRESGIKLMTGTQIVRVAKGRIYLKGRKSIATDTVIWCGGLRGLPIYESIRAPLDEKGRLRVNSSLQVLRHPNIYAMGDAINTEVFKTPVPRSGQAAYQQASVIAGNILASDSEKPLKRFKYVDLGEIIPVGGRYALARILCVPLGGMPAWMLEKAIFIMRIPGLANKARVLNGLAIDPLVEKGEEYLEKW
jgi:NADH dehydrogenase